MSHKWLDIFWETTECKSEETTAIHPRRNAELLVPIDPEHVEIVEVTLAWTVTFEQPGFQTDVRSVTTAWFAGLVRRLPVRADWWVTVDRGEVASNVC